MTEAIQRYYDQSYPPSVYAPPAPPATGATAGIPGSWTPGGSLAPASVAALQGGTPNAVTASPATAWTSGQFVQTRTTGAAGRATWTGTGWVGGAAPLQAEAEAPTGYTAKATKTSKATSAPEEPAAALDATPDAESDSGSAKKK